MVKKLTVYHKPCLTCKFDEWYLVEAWAQKRNIALRRRRTEYNPFWHRLATEVWGNELYPPFMTDGTHNITVDAAIKRIKRREEDDLQNLFRTKKRARKARKVVAG